MLTEIDETQLRQAVSELARLKSPAEENTGIIPQLYASALEEWASRFGIEAGRLEEMVAAVRRDPDEADG